jgi:hypothetical protein
MAGSEGVLGDDRGSEGDCSCYCGCKEDEEWVLEGFHLG